MLDNLLNAKLKKKLLGIFFAHPQRSFSLFELRAATGAKNSQIQKVLREFVRAQVVEAAHKKQKRFFRINPHFRLYEELEDLLPSSEFDAEDEVSRLVKKIPNVNLAILSGIFTFQPQLGVDLLLVGDGLNRFRVSRVLEEVQKLAGQEVNYAMMKEEEYKSRQMMSDRFMRDILDHPHLVILDNLK